MVPVERIELPTFGLQNRCSTAELNRQLNDAQNPALSLLPAATAGLLGQGRRQISELCGKGYWQEMARGQPHSRFQRPRSVRLTRIGWHALDGLGWRKPCPGHGEEAGVL
jgi:hypothetical protein